MSISGQYGLNLHGAIEDISISSIVRPLNVLRSSTMNGVEDLADSINKIGLLQPIVVRTTEGSGGFEIVAGNRRYSACRQLGWRKITCHIVELDDKGAFEIGLAENIQRQTLNPVEEGLAFRKYVNEFGWGGVSELAQKVSKSPSYVCRRMKLLELPKDVLDLISESQIYAATAEELLSIKNKNRQSELAKIIREKHMSSRKARMMIKGQERDHESTYFLSDYRSNLDEQRVCKSFDKSVIALKIALNKLGLIIENIEENWVFYEIFMQHKNMLHRQIDLLIREEEMHEQNPLFILTYFLGAEKFS
jgi:ParB family transcriptional regulator, chromosome partitioning protein